MSIEALRLGHVELGVDRTETVRRVPLLSFTFVLGATLHV